MPIDFSKMKSRSNMAAEAKKDLETPRTGAMTNGVLDLSKAPYPLESWKTDKAAKDWELDILAIPTENPDNPMVRTDLTAVGEWHFHLALDVHQFLAGSSQDVVCLKQLGQKCPACKAFFEFHNEHNKGLNVSDPKRKKNPYSVSKRSYMLVHPRKNNPEDKVYLYNASRATGEFVDSLLARATSTRGGAAPVDFAHPENGAVVMFDTVQKQGGSSVYYPAVNFDFRPRPKEEGLALWKRTFALDSLMKLHTKAEIEDILYDGPGASQGAQEPSSQGSSRSTYHTEEADAPDTQETRTQHGKPEPDRESLPVEDGKWSNKEPEKAEAPKDTGNKCPEGLEYGKSCVDDPQPRACRNCDRFDNCVENK